MTIDERLEALTHNVELIALAQKDSSNSLTVSNGIVLRLEKKVEDIAEIMQELATTQLALQKTVDQLAGRMDQLAGAQVATELKLQAFIDSLRKGGNGHA
ncbi:MAG: hypothetical protein JO323_06345 [Acidobacteriia bacterium]|nr:hypothetical protein [Terriglobia bacterium]